MPLLTVNNLSFSYSSHQILEAVTFAVEPGERIGLVGRNGTGKSTLLKIIAGQLQADSGTTQTTRGTRIGFLVQDPVFDPESTVLEIATTAFTSLHEAHEKLNRVAEEMGRAEGTDLEKLLKQYEHLEREIECLGGYTVEHRIEETLHGLGFSNSQFTQKIAGLSGGERSRLALAKLLLESPDLLLLDEPTNHLDIEGRRWLEQFLIDEFRGAVLIVSHDRYLLDRVVNRIFETEVDASISTYPGNYAQFRSLRYDRKLTLQREYDKQQDHVRREREFIRRYKAGQRAKQASGRESRLQRFKDDMAARPLELETMRLTLPKPERTGDIVLKIESIAKSFGDHCIIKDFSFTVSRGDRIGIIGPNGAGKSTLVECILNRQPLDHGQARLGANVSLGYFSQLHKNLRLDQNVYRYLQTVIKSLDGSPLPSEQQARDLAGAFLFSGADQEKTLELLSGGERSRAVLAGIVAGGHNLLVLDEPTNHFDIPSSERLEQALSVETGYGGTVIIISHDRAFLDATVNQLFILDTEGNIHHFLGNYADYREHCNREEQRLRALENERKRAEQHANRNNRKKQIPAKASPAAKAKAKNNKDKSKPSTNTGALSKLSMAKLEAQIEAVESRLREIDAAFLDPATQRKHQKVEQLSHERLQLLADLEPLEFEWARRAEED